MKTTKILACLGLTALLLATVTGCNEARTQTTGEKPTLQGRWSGFELGRPDDRILMAFETNRFTYWDAKTNEIGRGTFVANETVKPMQMDLTFEQIPATQYVGKVGLAIYELRGDKLNIAGSEPGSTSRPASLFGGEGVRSFTFTRQ